MTRGPFGNCKNYVSEWGPWPWSWSSLLQKWGKSAKFVFALKFQSPARLANAKSVCHNLYFACLILVQKMREKESKKSELFWTKFLTVLLATICAILFLATMMPCQLTSVPTLPRRHTHTPSQHLTSADSPHPLRFQEGVFNDIFWHLKFQKWSWEKDRQIGAARIATCLPPQLLEYGLRS